MAKFKGTSAGEVYSGTSGTDKIDGRGGDDQLYGLGGDDKIKGGKGNDSLDGGDGKDKLKGGKGNDALHGGAGDDKLDGGKGDDFLDGGDDDDKLKGGKGDDTLLGGAGDDKLDGGKGDDFLDGGAGDDKLKAGKGDDEAAYTMAENAGASDDYRGGRGIDTLTLNLTAAEWFQADVQSDIADYLQFLAAHINPGSGEADSDEFQFSAFDLEVREFENLRVIVDGNEIDPTDQAVDAVDDSVGIFEGDSATVFPSVLANDDVPDLAYSVELVSGLGAGEGTLVFNAGSPGAPDGSFSYDPGLDFEYLAFGETHDVSFTYKVTDADGDVDTATVTITVTGTNDAPVAVADFATATAGGALLADLDALAVNDTQGAGGTFFTQLLSNDGSGNFTDTLAGGAAVRSSDVALGDLDGDGDLDAVISVFGNNIAPVLINQGGTQGGTEGTFTVSNVALPQLSFGNPGNTGFGVNFGLDVELGDVDGDGDLDALLANWNNQSNVLLTNDGSGNFTTSLLAGGIKSWSRDIRLADVDADGDLDALVSTDNNINQLYTNQGGTQGGTQGIFVASNLPSVLNQLGSLSIGIDTGDVNGDGHLDVLITNILDQNEILLGDGTGTFTPGVLAGGNRQSTSIRLGDLDGDGDLDAFVSNVSNQLNQVLINQGGTQGGTEGTFVASDVGTVGRNSQSVALVDVDQDGDLDAVVGNNSFNTAAVPDQTNQVYLNDGFGGFTATTLAGGNNPTNSVEFGDLDGDGATPATNAQGLPNLPLGGGTPAGPVTGSVATNDSDVDNGAILSFALDAPVAGLTLDADGSYSFDASDPAYSTIPSGDVVDVVANYTVTDEYGASAQSTLTISVTGTGTPGPTGALKLVAYVDTDLDHDYTEGVDAMIAGLYDSNASGVIDVGDELWLDAFPLDLDDTTTGEYSGKGPHAITNVINGAPVGYGIRVTVDSGDEFYFNKIGAGGAVGASTEAMSGGGSYFVDFNFGRDTWQHGDFNFMDRIVVSDANATTQADQAVPDTLTTDYFNAHLYALNRDGSFFDIDIF